MVELLLAWLAAGLLGSSLRAPGSLRAGAAKASGALPACCPGAGPLPPCCLIWSASIARLLCSGGSGGAGCRGGRVFSKELRKGASAFLPVRAPLCSSAVKLDWMLAMRSGAASSELPRIMFSGPLGGAAGGNSGSDQ